MEKQFRAVWRDCFSDTHGHPEIKIRTGRAAMGSKLEKDTTNRSLGRKPQVCRICGAKGKFKTVLAREMMQGTGDAFPYFECDRCHCLQIVSVPENLGDYYGDGYYSYQVEEAPDMVFETPVTDTRRILDVGCGAGAWLLEMARQGFGNLYGCDPFLARDRRYGDRVTIRSCSIHEMAGEGVFDQIRMSDSFEHMTDPLEVLKSVRRLLKDDGELRMTIPTYPNIAFEQYGPHWYQLDAPRHIFLHSKQSLAYLAEKSGLVVSDVCYNSNNSQFIRSYLYQHGIPFYEQQDFIGRCFDGKQIARLDRASMVANARENGDHMEVRWRKNPILPGDGKKVIYMRFPGQCGRHTFLYPPVWRDADTDYLCFTDDETLQSAQWNIRRIENPLEADLEPYLQKYGTRWELKHNQIQMGSLWDGHLEENIVTFPALDELPCVELDFENFERTADENGRYIYRKNPVYHGGKYNGRPLLLTIGVPVSNQIDTIERCLDGIKPLLDELDSELVVVDTGSTDGTLDVCRRYGARIVTHPWHNNMSAVRNEGIYNAKGLWYMSIDDDEWFEDVTAILDFFKKGTYRRYHRAMYIQRNYINLEGKVYDNTPSFRLAEITPDLHFEGRIHDAMVIRGETKGAVLDSYVHHFGFVRDDPEKEKAKAVRNLSILPYDIYEYPGDVRYLFQLGKECGVLMGRDLSKRLLGQAVALSMISGSNLFGRYSVMELFYQFYNSDDCRLFTWADHFQKLFTFVWAEQAAIAWYQEELAVSLNRPAREVVGYYEVYEKMLQKFRQDPVLSRSTTMNGLSLVERESCIMAARADACWKYLDLGEEERAAEILRRISLDAVKNRYVLLMEKGFIAGDEVFDALCNQISGMQWEEWSGEILNIFVMTLKQEDIRERQARRLPEILRRISVDSVIAWVESHERKYKGEPGKRLIEYALELDVDSASIQELCMASWMLKEEYIIRRGSTEADALLRQYILTTGAFAACYYSEGQLTDGSSRVISPDIRALYYMALVLSDGRRTRENVALLKQALAIFPPFHEEIRELLTQMKTDQK